MLVVLGLLITVPAAILFALVTNVLPLAAVLPATMRATGPVTATAPAVTSVGCVLLAGAMAFAQGVHRIARGRWSGRLFVAVGLGGTLLVVAGVMARP